LAKSIDARIRTNSWLEETRKSRHVKTAEALLQATSVEHPLVSQGRGLPNAIKYQLSRLNPPNP